MQNRKGKPSRIYIIILICHQGFHMFSCPKITQTNLLHIHATTGSNSWDSPVINSEILIWPFYTPSGRSIRTTKYTICRCCWSAIIRRARGPSYALSRRRLALSYALTLSLDCPILMLFSCFHHLCCLFWGNFMPICVSPQEDLTEMLQLIFKKKLL